MSRMSSVKCIIVVTAAEIGLALLCFLHEANRVSSPLEEQLRLRCPSSSLDGGAIRIDMVMPATS